MPKINEKVMNLENLKYDKEISIATASNRQAKKWKNQQIDLKSFVRRLSRTARTSETVIEYRRMPKGDQDNIKDVGAFVGGVLKGGRRRKGDVANRQILTYDADYAGPDTMEKIKKSLKDYCFTIYSTHKHTPEKPRLRLIVYPDRPLMPDEYQAVARRIGNRIDLDIFDDTTFDVNRLFYWPSTPADGEYEFYHNDAPFLPVDKILAAYGDGGAWQDVTLWPVSSRETKAVRRLLKKQANPLEKKGVVGAFCRVVSIYDALDTHLSDVYRKDGQDRYTFIEGSSSKGLVVYDGMFCYSNHGTDPAHGQCCNAFDIIRIHKFGHLDADAKPGTPGGRMPSYKAMGEYARTIKDVQLGLIKDKIDIGPDAFDDMDEVGNGADADDWLMQLRRTESDAIKPSFANACKILKHDSKISGLMRKNLLSDCIERASDGEMWDAQDTDAIRKYIEPHYDVEFSEAKIERAVDDQAKNNQYHPIRDYIDGLEWDGVERVETLFIDYFRCHDCEYTREATKAWFTAAVQRIYEPGTKFDTVIVLGGAQNIGKTSFIEILAKHKWYGMLSSFDNKIAMEETQGKWLIEIAELSATSKQEIEQQKAFLSARSTKVRMAYARRATEFRRQCVFMGTTNQDEYLKDRTGNRRWWPLDSPRKDQDWYDMDKLEADVDQIWAEAYWLYSIGQPLLLVSKEAREQARMAQEHKLESDPWEGQIHAWLEEDAPVDRYEILQATRDFCTETEPRNRVCVPEIAQDCLNLKYEIKPYDRRRITSIMNRAENWEKAKSTMRFGLRFGIQKGWKKSVPF